MSSIRIRLSYLNCPGPVDTLMLGSPTHEGVLRKVGGRDLHQPCDSLRLSDAEMAFARVRSLLAAVQSF
jgi:hypothetical protein